MWVLTSIWAIIVAGAFVAFFKWFPDHIEEFASILIWFIVTVVLLYCEYDRPLIWISLWLIIAAFILAYKWEKKDKKNPKQKNRGEQYHQPVTKHWYYDKENDIRYN